MMIDTSPWSSCSLRSPWLPCSGHTISSTGPSVSPFRDFLCQSCFYFCLYSFIFSHLISLWLIVPELSRSNILKASSISSSVTFKQSVTLNVVDSVYTKKSLQKEPSQLSSHNSHFSEQVQSTWMFCHFDYFCKNNHWLEKITKIQSNQYLN